MSHRLGVVPSFFAVDHLPHATLPEDDEWIALVRAPEGLTVVREAWSGERWVGLYGGAPGGLAGMVGPLTDADIRVFVASTFHGDLVLVPEHRAKEAVRVLEDAGHRVDAKHLT
ncbi:ACT domain-containing protein [Nonomuraea sp. NPDC050310]|uniref:ACT domain-containing protein n=1 Tax=Nonomuraea sp. NPDC050310 TaxID=3154935 RepID=UPI0033D896C7